MIYYLLLYSCMMSGKDCRAHVVNVERMHMGECMMASQIEGANYKRDHPNRKIIGFKCTDRPQKYMRTNEA